MDWRDVGITPPPGKHSGKVRAKCPKCSGDRDKKTEMCLSLNFDVHSWFCYHCGWHGWLKDREDFKGKKTPRVVITEKSVGSFSDKAVEYLRKRGLTDKTIYSKDVGFGMCYFAERKRELPAIRYKYYYDGDLVNIKHSCRNLDPKTPLKLFAQEKGGKQVLYRFDEIAAGKGTLVITEGEVDALTFVESGYPYATSVPSGASVTDGYFDDRVAEVLSHYDKVVLAVDNDAKGVALERELARRIGVEKCWRVDYPEGCKDANDVLVKLGKDAVVKLVDDAQPFPVNGLYSVTDLVSVVHKLYTQGLAVGQSSGWKCLDPYLQIHPGYMTIVTGIPGMGKSTFVDHMLINLHKRYGWKFVVCSPENWPLERHVASLLEKYHNKPFSDMGGPTPKMTVADVHNGMMMLGNAFHFVYPEEDTMTIDYVLEKTRAAVLRYGVKGLVIDPWNEFEHNAAQREDVYISKLLSKIRRFARQNGIHIWVVAHPTKQIRNEDGTFNPPSLNEVSGGHAWYAKADYGITVHRPDPDQDISQVHITKVRFREMGRIGGVMLKFCRETGTFFE